nr:FkbM family methyltransferase [uncultured Hyphomonas sp.]
MPFELGEQTGLVNISIQIKKKGGVGIGWAYIGDDADLRDRFEVKKALLSIVRLDDVMARMDFGPVSLIKVDVEGGELNALKGALGLITSQKPAILCEIDGGEHRFGSCSQELSDFLSKLGYVPHGLETSEVLKASELEKIHFSLLSECLLSFPS